MTALSVNKKLILPRQQPITARDFTRINLCQIIIYSEIKYNIIVIIISITLSDQKQLFIELFIYK